MLQLLSPIASLFVGIAMTIYGIVHSITRFPGGDAFATLAANMPAVMSVLVFLLGIFAFAVGIVLMVIGIKKTLQRWRQFNRIAHQVGDNPPYDEENWEGAAYH